MVGHNSTVQTARSVGGSTPVGAADVTRSRSDERLHAVAIFLLALASATVCGLLLLAALVGQRRAHIGHRFEDSIRHLDRAKSFTVR